MTFVTGLILFLMGFACCGILWAIYGAKIKGDYLTLQKRVSSSTVSEFTKLREEIENKL